jgi:hypothetical protein
MKKILILLAAVLLLAGYSQAQSLDFNGHSYVVLPAMTYAEATDAATALGGHLATIDDYAEYIAVTSAFENSLKGTVYFLGYQSVEYAPFQYAWSRPYGNWQLYSPTYPTYAGEVIVMKKYYSIVNRRVVYRQGYAGVSPDSIYQSIVEIEPISILRVAPGIVPVVDSTPVVIDPNAAIQ